MEDLLDIRLPIQTAATMKLVLVN